MAFRIERFFIKIARPLNLLGGILLYALGVGISHYLGNQIDWGLVFLGQIWVTTLQLGFHFLTTFFHHPTAPGEPDKFYVSSEGDEKLQLIRRDLILSGSFTAFAVAAMLSFLLFRNGAINGAGVLIMGIMILVIIGYAVPPFQIIITGYGELLESIMMVNLIPALAYVLQSGELHRLVAITTFPLTLLYLAQLLALQLPNFASDIRTSSTTLLTRLGWERGMVLHNILILSSFLLFGLAVLFGLSLRVMLPVYFVLPLGLFQIWYMARIASGVRPNWRILNVTAILTLGLTVYLLAFSFWIQ